MEITDIRIREVFDYRKLRALVSITFNEVFVVHDIKIIQGEDGLFIAMPSRKNNEGEYRDTAHPINKEFRLHIQDQIIKAYESATTQVS